MIFCLQDGRIFSTTTKNVAVGRDFYRLTIPSALEMKIVEWTIAQAPATSRKPLQFFADVFPLVASLAALVGQFRDVPEDLLAETERTCNDMLEDYHAGLEDIALPLMVSARKGDLSFMENADTASTFCYYLAQQCMRTRTMKERMVSTMKGRMGIDINGSWHILSNIFAVNIGASLFAKRREQPPVLLKRGSEVRFITSDQPVLNLDAKDDGTVPNLLSIYYPLSPDTSLVITDNDSSYRFADTLTSEQTNQLNLRIADASHTAEPMR